MSHRSVSVVASLAFLLGAGVAWLVASRFAPAGQNFQEPLFTVVQASPGPTSMIMGGDTLRSICVDVETDRKGRMVLGACLTLYADGSVGIQRDDRKEQRWPTSADVPAMERRWFKHRYQVLHLLACKPDPVTTAAWPQGRYVSQCGWFGA